MPDATTKPFVITIDGPAGSGKSTVSAKLAERLKLNFLTTGAFYRGLALLCRAKKIDTSNQALVAEFANYSEFKVLANSVGTKVFIDGQDVTHELAQESVAKIASQISAYPEVRKALLERQRQFGRGKGLIAEGRDCGTVVFPEAQVKIYLTASLDKRAERRLSEDKTSSTHELTRDMANRDKADSGRKAAPLMKAFDSVEIDSSTLSVEEVVARIEEVVRSRQSGS